MLKTLSYPLPTRRFYATLPAMDRYDYVMAGGGMAGLSLAYAIAGSRLTDKTMLIVDPESKGENDRTWCYWTRGGHPIESVVSHVWGALRFASHSWTRDFDLGDYCYAMVRGDDFYRETLDRLEQHPGVEFERGRVTDVRDEDGCALVETEQRSVAAEWVFDSRFEPEEYEQRSGPHHYLKQHFVGWVIETPEPVFDPHIPTLFDFRTPGYDEMRFIYILPFSEHRALVEYTLFSAELLRDDEYIHAIETYLREIVGVTEYRVVDRERGVIPMTDEPIVRREGRHRLAIGTRGGRVKASTGYAFRRTQLDSQAIVESLLRWNHPFDLPAPPRRARMLDTMLLEVMHRRGELSEQVFTALFRRNPIDRLLQFLDEETSLAQTLAVMATVPLPPFLAAFWRTQIAKQV